MSKDEIGVPGSGDSSGPARPLGGKPAAGGPAQRKAANLRADRRRETKARKTLDRRLIERLDELAKDIPYAAQLAAKLRAGCDEATLGDIVVDVMCMYALKGNLAALRSLWERSDGKPPAGAAPEDREPKAIRMPLAAPPQPTDVKPPEKAKLSNGSNAQD